MGPKGTNTGSAFLGSKGVLLESGWGCCPQGFGWVVQI